MGMSNVKWNVGHSGGFYEIFNLKVDFLPKNAIFSQKKLLYKNSAL